MNGHKLDDVSLGLDNLSKFLKSLFLGIGDMVSHLGSAADMFCYITLLLRV